jgi:hypothetical protein
LPIHQLRLHSCIKLLLLSLSTFMQDINNYIPETNHVSRVYNVAAVLCLQFVLQVMLFQPWNIFCYLLLLFYY